MTSPVKLLDIIQARERIRPYVNITPLEPAPRLGAQAYFKLENVNIQHSFKIRGALNAVLAQKEQAHQFGVITSSAGNHGLGLVYSTSLLGIKATVVMPTHAPQRKINGVRQFGADVVLHGDIYDDAEEYARRLEQETGGLFVSPYNDPYIVAGQGTMALELVEQLPDIGRVLLPTGGGGLIAGMGLAMKAINPEVEVIGVQSVATPAMYNYLRGENLPQNPTTLADGLSGDIEKGSITLTMCKVVADDMLLVTEQQIADAIRWMFRHHGWVIEGSAAVGIAAITNELIPADDVPTVAIITGSNIDADKFLALMTTSL